MKTPSFLHYLCTLLPLIESAEAQLLPAPRLSSKFQLPNLTFQRGNALIHYVDSVVATTAEGSLVRVSTSDKSIVFAFTPEMIADRELSSPSGVAVVRENLAIYSVIDAAADEAETTSRVLCVSLEDGTLVWSASVIGRVIGTPQVSDDLVYLVHNTNVGGITVLRFADGGEPATVGTFATEDTTFGPGSLVSLDKTDVLAVASNRENGFSEEGGLYMLIEQQVENNDKQGGAGGKEGGGKDGGNQGAQSAGFKLVQVSTLPRSSVTAPLLSENMELVMGQQGASLTAWAGDNDLSDVLVAGFENVDFYPRWERFVDENPDDGDAPILSTPIFSTTGEMVYVASAGPQFTAVMLQDGTSAWSVDTKSTIEASPVLGEDVVYTIESSGRVSQYDAIAGDVNWVMDCDVAGTCDSSVEADFALSDTGNELYFGDSAGNIISVIVGGNFTSAPTSSPIQGQPEVSAPTRSPTAKTEEVPAVPVPIPMPGATDAPSTASPTEDTKVPGESEQQNPNNDEKKTGGYLAAAIVSVAAFILAFAACYICRRNATAQKQQLAYEQACRNAEKEALEEIMRTGVMRELMDQSATETFFYGEQTLATPMSIPGMSIPERNRMLGQDAGDSDGDSEEQIGFEVDAGEQQVSPVYARPVDPPEKQSSRVSKNQYSSDSSVRHKSSVPSADIEKAVQEDEEPGRIVFRERNDSEDNEAQRPPSPAFSDAMSDDDSLYTTEEPRPLVLRYISDDPKQMIGRSFRGFHIPDDESSKASAFPGITSYFRTPSKKPTSPESTAVANETLKPEVSSARTLAYAGVSVRQGPSKSRAGLFSRRSPAIVNKASPTNTTEATGVVNHSPPEPKPTYEAFKPEHVPVAVPPPQDPVSVPSPQEDEKEAPPPSSDVWNSFLSELAKAEQSFFGSSDKVARPPSPPPPPPPPEDVPPLPSLSANRTKSADAGNKGYFWV